MKQIIKCNVLMVDDRPENLLAIEATLEGLDLNLVRATSGEEALKCLLRADYAVILMDVQMPGLSGFETATLIKQREKTRFIPIIFLTAISKEERYVFEGYAVGAVDYMFKPFEPEILKSKVAVFVDLFRKNEQIKLQSELLRLAENRERQREILALTRANEERYRNLAEAIPQIVFTADSDGRFTYFNQRWWTYTGLPKCQMDVDTFLAVTHPDDVAVFHQGRETALTSGEGAESEIRLRRGSDGTYRWHLLQANPERDVTGKIIAWLGACTDFDDRIRAKNELKQRNREIEAEVAQRTRQLEAQRRFSERLIDNAPAGIAYVDNGLVYRSVNPEFVRFAGQPADQIIGKSVQSVELGNADFFEPLLRKVLETCEPCRMIGIPFPNPKMEALTAAGEGRSPTLYMDITYFPVLDDARGIHGVLIFSLDVSDRVENERMQREQIEHLHMVDNLKDEFLSVISHELRTPLNFIMGFASILDDEVAGNLSQEQHVYLDKILTGTDRMLVLVNDLLDFAKIQAGQFELFEGPVDYGPLIDDVLTTLKPLADQKGLVLASDVPKSLQATCDPERVVQILTNLVGNAIKFTPRDGMISVNVREVGGQVCTEIEDTGIGIAPENIEKLFTRFRQLDMSRTRKVGGTGLGLSISKALVEAHGGNIEGTSPGLGKGSVFRFTLKVCEEEASTEERLNVALVQPIEPMSGG